MKIGKIVLITGIIVLTMTGCNHHRLKPHRFYHNHNNASHNSAYRQASTNGVPRFTQIRGAYPQAINQGRYGGSRYQPVRESEILKPAHSMAELDEQSRNVKPTMIYSYPRGMGTRGTNFVNLMAIKYRLLDKINAVRANGAPCSRISAPPVKWNRKLVDAAKAHAQDMAMHNFLGHLGSGTSTDVARKALGRGSNFYERILYFGYPIKPGELAGEILTYTKYNIVGDRQPLDHFDHALENFLRSPRHCALLMNPRFSDVGIAAYKDNEKIYWDIEFGESAYN